MYWPLGMTDLYPQSPKQPGNPSIQLKTIIIGPDKILGEKEI